MDRDAEELKLRTRRFLHRILDFVDTLPHSLGTDILARQLIRGGAGVAGNYHAACRSRSHAEFTARLGVVLEEADESELWIGVMNDRKWGDTGLRGWLFDESAQLRAIFSKGCVTARAKETARRRPPES